MAENAERIKQLRHKRGAYKAQLTLFEKYLSKIQVDNMNSEDESNLSERLEKVKPVFELHDAVLSELEFLTPDANVENLQTREAFDNTYFHLISKAKNILTKFKPANATNITNAQPQVPPRMNVKLPNINLPTFNGQFTQWYEFFDTFNALIVSNVDLTESQKLCYLKASLTDEPANMIRSLQTIDTNFIIAWDSLCSRYNNKRRIVDNHINEILNLETIGKGKESHVSLRSLIDVLNNHIRCLKTLKQPTDQWNALLVPIILSKLSPATISEWESKLNEKSSDTIPTIDEFLSFLNTRQNFLESVNARATCNASEPSNQKETKHKHTKSFATFQAKCPNCEGTHFISQCEKLLHLNKHERIKRCKDLKLCLNCLRKGHFIPECQSSSCKTCNKRHHTMLHIDVEEERATNSFMLQSDANQSISQLPINMQTNKNLTKETESINLSNLTETDSIILLSTANINAFNNNGDCVTLRALLDSASQSNFITERAAILLNLTFKSVNLSVTGITQSSTNISKQTILTISSKHNNYKTQIECFSIPSITRALPTTKVDISSLQIPENIKLADRTFNQPGEVDMLIGATLFWQLISIGQIKNKNGPTFQKTKLGWIISGPVYQPSPKQITSFLSLSQLESDLQRFWKLDEIQQRNLYTDEETFCETHFKETHTRDNIGKFIVHLPLKPQRDLLGDSYDIAKTRFFALENRMKNNKDLKNTYTNVIKTYESQGHMTLVTERNHNEFFLPHHAVFKDTSTSTKVRVVFDGSCKPETGLPINNLQCVGPTIQDDLFSILSRFRTHQFVITGDITQMYRQIWIHPNDRKYQKILWRDNPDDTLNSYELNTVTFGTAAAPFLAIRCLRELANLNEHKYPVESNIIKHDFYVDDVLTGSNSIADLVTIKRNLTDILSQGSFVLTKWKSNVPALSEGSEQSHIALPKDSSRVLGISWNPNTDSFLFSIPNIKISERITKRTILSSIAQFFDPLGLLAPMFVIPKIIMQKIWQIGLTWDEAIPNDLHFKYLQFKNDLRSFPEFVVPRCTIIPDCKSIELHGFSDASERAYGACIYLKSIDSKNKSLICLVASKSRVAPIKTLTLPRLELSAAVQLAQLMAKLKSILNLNVDKEYLWCDSTIVLCWLRESPTKWVTFVANRVSIVQELTDPNNWCHVNSQDNPADVVSRGRFPSEIISDVLWWQGPKWLLADKDNWPTPKFTIPDIPEQRKSNLTLILTHSKGIDLTKFSSLKRLTRTVAYCLRFKSNCVKKKRNQERTFGTLTVTEINTSLLSLIRLSQITYFANEYDQLLNNKPLVKNSHILSLCPFMDENKLMRVGGRLTHSNFAYDKRHPILLSNKAHITRLILKEAHVTLLHIGPNSLLNHVREKYWPVSGRNLAKLTVRMCTKCFRFNPKTNNQLMASLPSSRVIAMPPFHTVGVDYGGPILIKDKLGRGNKTTKCYIALFICFTTRAIHLEPVTALTTNGFIAALRRFVGRRGKPLHIYSDNGTNFQGANTEIKRLYEFLNERHTEIIENSCTQGINWHFIPANSPHFGGIWEAGIKSTKHHLKKIMYDSSLTYEDLYTALVQIESILNSRPLTPLTSNPNDLQALTPAHFLIGRPLMSVADPDVTDIKLSRLDRYQYIQRLNQGFWKRWATEYISNLQQRQKWKQQGRNVKIGTLVLIREDNLPPCQWRLGRVHEVHPGSDGIVRVVTIKCSNGLIKRSVAKICEIPTNDSIEQ